MRPSSPGMARAFAEGAAAAGADVDADRAGLDRPALLRLRVARPARRDVHREPQPGAVQRHQDVPRRRRPDRHGHRAGRDPRPASRPASRRRPRRPATIVERDVLDDYAAHLLGLAPVTGRRLKVVVDAGNGMAGHTAPGRARAARPRRRAAVLRARRHLPEPRGQPDRAGQPGRPAGQGAARPAPTSAWPSTATPTAASSSTSAASWSARRVLTALIAVARAGPGARRRR